MAGRVGPAGLNFFAATEGHAIGFDPCQERCSDQTCWIGSRGAMLKRMMSKVIKDTHASGIEAMDMILSEFLNGVNEMTRHGGFAPGTVGTLASSS